MVVMLTVDFVAREGPAVTPLPQRRMAGSVVSAGVVDVEAAAVVASLLNQFPAG